MQERYLYRAKRIDNGEWIQGDLVHSIYKKGDTCVGQYENGVGMHVVDPYTICQYTGLKDKNGNLIWENDIIQTEVGVAKVIWNKSEWRIEWRIECFKDNLWRKDLYYWAIENDQEIEVIGNTFDNPELLEGRYE